MVPDPIMNVGVCKGEGTIIIDGPIHQEMKKMKQETLIKRSGPGIYQYGKWTIMKVAKDCWRITTPGYGNDFVTKRDAYYWCANGGSLYPPVKEKENV